MEKSGGEQEGGLCDRRIVGLKMDRLLLLSPSFFGLICIRAGDSDSDCECDKAAARHRMSISISISNWCVASSPGLMAPLLKQAHNRQRTAQSSSHPSTHPLSVGSVL